MRRMLVVTVVVLAVAAVACKPYDFNGDGKADVVLVDENGNWTQHGQVTPFHSAPPGFDLAWTAPGDYDGNKVPEPTNVSYSGEWQTGGQRGTFLFPPPDDYSAYPVPGDYDGDGDTDAAWYDGADATWHVEGQAVVQFGVGNDAFIETWAGNHIVELHDVPVPGNFDNDKADEIAVYRPTDGTFHVLGIGQIADLPLGYPAVGDFDGDKIDEPVVYRDNFVANDDGSPPQETHAVRWYFPDGSTVSMENPEVHAVPRRTSAPVPADYDGDGDDDLAASVMQRNTVVFADGRPAVDLPDGDVGPPPGTLPASFPTALRIEFYLLTLMQEMAGELSPHATSQPGSAETRAVTDDGRWFSSDETDPHFGPSGALSTPVAGDYDGDGRWEAANVLGTTWATDGERGAFVFDPGSVGSGAYVPADYDGDLVADPAWFSEATAHWHIEGEAPIQYGTPASASPPGLGDVAVPADYDGDGEDELAVYRPSDGTFHVRGVGQIADLPVGFPAPADFDGDGVVEPAVYQAIEHRWYFADGTSALVPALAGSEAFALPAPAAYSEGREEPVVFHAATKTFHWVDGGTEVVAASDGLSWPGALPSGSGRSQLFRLVIAQLCEAAPGGC